MSLAFLPDRGVLEVAGPDRAAFLQGLVSNDVAGICLFGQRAVLREEKLRRRKRQRFRSARQPCLHPTPESAGAQARKCNAVAMIGVHVGLDFEHECRHRVLVCVDRSDIGDLRTRRGCKGRK